LFRRQVHARKILVGVVVSSPLPRLAVENQRPTCRSRNRPECVLPRGDHRRTKNEILVGAKHRRGVGTGAPDLIPWNDAAPENHATTLERAAVSDREIRATDGCP